MIESFGVVVQAYERCMSARESVLRYCRLQSINLEAGVMLPSIATNLASYKYILVHRTMETEISMEFV